MSNNVDIIEKHHVFTDYEDKYECKVRRSDLSYGQVYEYDKKIKREIANCNERRRMQSINTGFEILKELLPKFDDCEKLSKASILQLTAKYIQSLVCRLSKLEEEIAIYKTRLPNKDKNKASKSSSTLSQEQTRKRRLNSDTSATVIPDFINKGTTTTLYSKTDLVTCDNDVKAPGSLEHLVAAIEQVEGEQFYAASTSDVKLLTIMDCSTLENSSKKQYVHPGHDVNNMFSSNHSLANCVVMKPTISPYTEKIILAVSQYTHVYDTDLSADIFYNTVSGPTINNKFQFIKADSNVCPQLATTTDERLDRLNAAVQKNKTRDLHPLLLLRAP